MTRSSRMGLSFKHTTMLDSLHLSIKMMLTYPDAQCSPKRPITHYLQFLNRISFNKESCSVSLAQTYLTDNFTWIYMSNFMIDSYICIYLFTLNILCSLIFHYISHTVYKYIILIYYKYIFYIFMWHIICIYIIHIMLYYYITNTHEIL